MIDIASFFTLPAQASGQNTPGGPQALSGGPSGALQIQGLGFIDLIIAHLQESNQSADTQTGAQADGGHKVLQSGNPLLDEQARLDLQKILAANSDIEKQIGDFDIDDLGQILALNQKAFDENLKPLIKAEVDTDGTITIKSTNAETETTEEFKLKTNLLDLFLIDGETDNQPALVQLKNALAKIERLDDEQGNPVFVATNLTPEQITALKEKVESLIDADDGTTNEDLAEYLLIGLVKILPPQAKPEVILLPQSAALSAQGTPKGGQPTSDLAGTLNSLTVGEDEQTLKGPAPASTSSDSYFDLDDQEFEDIIKQFTSKKNEAAAKMADGTGDKTPKVKPDLSVLQNQILPANGALPSDAAWMGVPFDDIGTPATNTMNAMSALTSTAAQAQSATTPHPATQMVAATIQKSAETGENRSITLQLDPPDLGKVQVRMEFGKDKTLKTTVISEKPETMMMLQRDAHLLERSLQDTGLSMDGGMNFELAGQDHPFNDGNGRGGGHDKGGKGAGDGSDDMELVTAEMTWAIDPETGHTRYNIMA